MSAIMKPNILLAEINNIWEEEAILFEEEAIRPIKEKYWKYLSYEK